MKNARAHFGTDYMERLIQGTKVKRYKKEERAEKTESEQRL